MMDFSDKVILIIGGTSGIGEGCVRSFIKSNGTVIFCSNDEFQGKKLEEEINTKKAKFVFCEVNKEDSVVAVVKYVTDKYEGVLHSLINVVGTHLEDRKIDDFSVEDFDSLYSINVRSFFLFSKYCLPLLRENKGNIVNIASLVGSIGQRNAVTYAASKGAVLAMTKSLALDESEHGVRVNSVSPSIINTPLLVKNTVDNVKNKGNTSYEDAINQMTRMIPLGKIGSIEDVASVCMFLASDLASYITGADIPVSGGAELGYGIKSSKF